MSIGTKIESLLDLIISDVVSLFETQPDDFSLITNSMDNLADLRPLMKYCSQNPDPIIGAAAIADVMLLIRMSILADDEVELDELEVARDVLSECLHRYSWIDNYQRYCPLIDATEAGDLLFTWGKDDGLLGGDFENGSVKLPFSKLIMVASILARNTEIHDRHTQVILLIAKLIVSSGGVNSEEREFLQTVKDWRDEERASLIDMFPAAGKVKLGHDSARTKADDQELLADEPINPERALTEALNELNELVGVMEVKNEISRLANFLKVRKQRLEAGLPVPSQSLHFVFTGNPGTGKTTVARIVSRLLYGFGLLKSPNVVETDRASLVGGYVGQTAIKTTEVIEKAIDGVLFIDEAYTLAKNEGGSGYGQEAIDTILKKMEDCRDRLVVIAAGYPELMKQFLATNPGLESRFTRFIHFEDYHAADLWEIYERMCKANSYTLTQDAKANLALFFNRAFAKRDKNFGNARFVRNAYEKTLGNHADRLAVFEGTFSKDLLVTIEASDLPYDMVYGMPGPLDVSSSRWKAQCPGCEKISESGIAALGKRVRCKCGTTFVFPAWNLNPESLPSFIGYKIYDRCQDLRGIPSPDKAGKSSK